MHTIALLKFEDIFLCQRYIPLSKTKRFSKNFRLSVQKSFSNSGILLYDLFQNWWPDHFDKVSKIGDKPWSWQLPKSYSQYPSYWQ